MKRPLVIKIIILIVVVILVGVGICVIASPKNDLKNIKSEAELYGFYDRDVDFSYEDNPLMRILLLPFSLGNYRYGRSHIYYNDIIDYATDMNETATSGSSTKTKDFSTTNIQVENVDEADIIKTDGDYMYSVSGTDVIISDVRNTSEPKIAARIEFTDESIPEDLILSGDTLTVIGTEYVNTPTVRTYDFYSRYYDRNNTTVRVYNISDRENPNLVKNYTLYEPYYTSRRIGDKLYVIASGQLRKKSGEELVDRSYSEDYTEKEFPVDSVRYLDGVLSDDLTLISVMDLSKPDSDIVLEPFLLDISNAYVSENAFYLLEESYDGRDRNEALDGIKALFGLKGVFGFVEEMSSYDNYSYGLETEIYKFNIEDSGNISYATKTEIAGETINQYSLDEKDGHLRIALEDEDGSYVAVFDEKLGKLGESDRLGKNERMYASRFLGDKAYLVTYKNTDPLFVIDLADESKPKVLGELKIPGYSVYLHPYDENHLIGIGVDTTEEIRKDENGRVISSFAYITGMKLALFDISDFNNPKEISKLHIGDEYTSSAILTNPKALLFSKEKQLLGIPVNNYASEFEIEIRDSDDVSELTDYFYDYKENYVNEGYIIYNIDLEKGIEQRGEVIHEGSSLIRGAYIEDDLLTVSEKMLKVNGLQDLGLKSELKLTKEEE